MNRRAICRLFKIKRFQPICKNRCHFIHFLWVGVRIHKELILDIRSKILSHGSFKNLPKPSVKLLQPLKQSLATTVWNVYQLISAVIHCIICRKLPTYDFWKHCDFLYLSKFGISLPTSSKNKVHLVKLLPAELLQIKSIEYMQRIPVLWTELFI